MNQSYNLFLKRIVICFLLVLTSSSLVACSSTSSSACVAGSTNLENDLISFCAEVDGKTQFISDGDDYENIILLMKLVAFNQEAFPEYVFEETPESNNGLSTSHNCPKTESKCCSRSSDFEYSEIKVLRDHKDFQYLPSLGRPALNGS